MANKWMIGALAAVLACVCASRTLAQGSLPDGDIPGNVLRATWRGADTAYSAVQSEIAAAMDRVFDSRNTPASIPGFTAQGRRDIQTAFLEEQFDFTSDFYFRFQQVSTFSDLNAEQVNDFGELGDPILDRLRNLRNVGRTQLTTYARTPRASAPLVRGLTGNYTIRRMLPNGTMSNPLAQVALNDDFTVTGSVDMTVLIRQLPVGQRPSVDEVFADTETLRGVRWFATGGRVFLVGPDFNVSAAATRMTTRIPFTGIDLFPEAANVIADSVLSDTAINAVRPGITAARAAMRGWTLYLVRTPN